MTTRAVLLKGVFDESDWAEILAAIRQIERRHQDDTYHIIRLDPDLVDQGDVVTAAGFLARTFPKVDGQEPEIWLQKTGDK